MSLGGDGRAQREVIEAERTAYLENLPTPESDWPPDVRAVYETLRERLFDWGGVEAQTVVEDDVWTEPCYGDEPPGPIEE